CRLIIKVKRQVIVNDGFQKVSNTPLRMLDKVAIGSTNLVRDIHLASMQFVLHPKSLVLPNSSNRQYWES
ncbi:hypothetical protein, partial [Reichenbachiella sp.]|uniref:hypothetical protein n=1 Tax=Reichenbachiella sp. TaxID=2184521 RepID=UPI003298922B